MTQRPVTIAAIAFSLALVIGTIVAGISILAHWDIQHDAHQAKAAKWTPATPYTFDGTRIVMR